MTTVPSKLRVTLLCLEWPSGNHSGGVARYAYRLALSLRELVDLTIVTYEGGNDLPGTTIVAVPRPAGRIGRYYGSPVRLRSVISAIPADVIHSFGDDWALRRSPVPLVRTFFGSSWSEARSSKGLRRMNHVVLAGSELVSLIRAEIRIAIAVDSQKQFKCQYLMPPVVDKAHPAIRRVPSTEPTVMFIGSYNGRKRGHLVERAVWEAREKLGRDIRLVVIGPESDKGNWGEDVVHLSGTDDETVLQKLSQAWVLVAPSSYEGFGIPVFEAMSHYVPAIASVNPGSVYMSNLVDDQNVVRLVDDPARLGSSLVAALNKGPLLTAGEAARADAAVGYLRNEASPTRLVNDIYSFLKVKL